MAEALITLHAVEFSKEMGFNDIILEGDVLQIVKTVKDLDQNRSNYGHIVEGIKMGLPSAILANRTCEARCE